MQSMEDVSTLALSLMMLGFVLVVVVTIYGLAQLF
jgi:hypothetical protein